MIVNKYFLIGNITVPSSWIALIVAFIVAYSLVRILFKAKSANKWADQFFTILVIWKLSVVVTHASLIMKTPMSIIYFNGGLFGFCLGVAYVFSRSWMDQRRGNITKEQWDSLLYGAVFTLSTYQAGMAVLNDGPIYVSVTTVVLFTALLLLAIWRFTKKKEIGNQEPLLLAAVHLFAASFQPAGLWNGALLVTLLIVGFWMLIDYRMEHGKTNTEELI
ncbi:hypothetical protein NCCP2222_38680 [Sporosarcina sp. NCCP-2222]|uniref:hypothetical protein n=1 Tax=Sporosarcina sp. NCCP-2222 TaxID=2935073 RepID=UPI002089DCFC|nr:hypothetical protein [Sporosarcina sp. NCCP-2222]GKV57921.1 hypothetical protein NCCP2222_38680 [Sporosarcina sp. NCCP-2222]